MTIINRRVTLLLVLPLFALPLLAGNDVSDLRYAPSDLTVSPPAIASSGNRFLTLWAAPPGERYPYVHIDGSLSDTAGSSNLPAFPVIPYANSDDVAVVGGGSGYVATWYERDVGSFFGRLTSDGILKFKSRTPIGGSRFSERVAFNGSEIAIVDSVGTVAFQPRTITLWIYDLDGNLLRSFPLMPSGGETYAITTAGDDFVVVTAGDSGIIEWRAPHDGGVHAEVRIVSTRANDVKAIAVAANNGRIVTAWVESRNLGSSGTLASATIQPDRTVTRNSLPAGGAPAAVPVILPVVGGYVIAWNAMSLRPAHPGMFAVRLNDSGTPVDGLPWSLGYGQFTSAASAGNTIKLACYTPEVSPHAASTVTATVDATGIAARPAVPMVSAVRQFAPAVTGNGAGFTAAWFEQESGASRVMAGRINPAGEPLDGTGITIDANATAAPVIAHAPSEDLIVWIGNGHLQATRLSPFAGLLDASPIIIAEAKHGSYDVVWNGTRFFVVWTDGLTFFNAFVGPDGTVTRGIPHIGGSAYLSPWDVDLAWDGHQYVLVFAEYAPELCDACGINGDYGVTRIAASGVAIDTIPVTIAFGGYIVGIHVASSGSESLIVLDDDSGVSSIVVRDQGGKLHLDPKVPLFTHGTSAVAWDGSSYVVAVRYALSQWLNDSGGLAAIQVSQSGVRLRTTIASTSGPPDYASQHAPSIATDVAAGTAFAIAEITPQTYVSRARLYLPSEFSSTPPPAPRNAVSYFSGTTARIDWQSDGGANGFVIDRSGDFGTSWSPAATTTADARTITVDAQIGDLVRIRAFGPGGLSEGTITSIGSMQRQRAERRH